MNYSTPFSVSAACRNILCRIQSQGGDWFKKYELHCILSFTLLAAFLRILLVVYADLPQGYYWDEYHHPVISLYTEGHLPESTRFWVGYHPPLYFYLGALFFGIGTHFSKGLLFLGLLAMVSCSITAFYCYKILRFFRWRGLPLILGTVVVLMFPCLFISSFGVDADTLLTTIMVMFTYHLLRYHAQPRKAKLRDAIVLGVLAGLAMSTKYSGIAALLMAGEFTFWQLLRGPFRMRAVYHGLLILFLCLAIGHWRYYNNYKSYGTVFYANGSAAQGFAMKKVYRWDLYDFFSIRMGDVFKLLSKNPPEGKLSSFPVFYSVWTSLHSQAWGDMSYWTEPSRYAGNDNPKWPRRYIPLWLPASVLVLAFVPNFLALIGLAATLRHRIFWPIHMLCVTTLLPFFQWMISQLNWSVKTKYILFLLAAYVVYMVVGVRWVQRFLPKSAKCMVWLSLGLLVLLTHLYLYKFATASPEEKGTAKALIANASYITKEWPGQPAWFYIAMDGETMVMCPHNVDEPTKTELRTPLKVGAYHLSGNVSLNPDASSAVEIMIAVRQKNGVLKELTKTTLPPGSSKQLSCDFKAGEEGSEISLSCAMAPGAKNNWGTKLRLSNLVLCQNK